MSNMKERRYNSQKSEDFTNYVTKQQDGGLPLEDNQTCPLAGACLNAYIVDTAAVRMPKINHVVKTCLINILFRIVHKIVAAKTNLKRRLLQ